jgi:nicotinamidase-related amidase
MVRTHLLIIDPQNDFCNKGSSEQLLYDQLGKEVKVPGTPTGELYVAGAYEDMLRLASFIAKNKAKLYDIHVTLDSHHLLQVFHPLFWRDVTGKHPAPFTHITQDDIEKGVWTPSVPAMRDRTIAYVKSLASNNRYQLIIWPEHCLIGSWGAQVLPELFDALVDWERDSIGMVDYVTKGSNLYTEHYSAVKAEVPDPSDASTQLNQALIDTLTEADIILVAGEALDYCLINSLRDIVTAFGPDNARKIKILEDCTSAIDPNATSKIKQEFGSLGIEFVNTTYFDK